MTSEFTPSHGVRFEISGQFAHFRDVFTQSFFATLPGPPRTTILGMIGAALGLGEAETIELGKKLLIGLKIIDIKGFANEVTTALNLKPPAKEKDEESTPTSWPTRTPVLRSLIVEPRYEVCVASIDTDLLSRIAEGLRSPFYPIYLGISDFIACVTRVDDTKILTKASRKTIDCATPVTSKDKPIERLHGSLAGLYVPPRKYHTIHSFRLTPKGREHDRYIDLLMFFRCSVQFSHDREVYTFEDGAHFCVF